MRQLVNGFTSGELVCSGASASSAEHRRWDWPRTPQGNYMEIYQRFPQKLSDVDVLDISTSELWVIKEQYENQLIPVMYGPIELRVTSNQFYLLGSVDHIYGATCTSSRILKLRKVTVKKALHIIIQ